MQKVYMRICAVILIFVMAFGFLPTSALAEEKPLYDISEQLYFGRNALMKLGSGQNFVAAYDAIGEAVKNGKTTVSISDYKIPATDLYLLIDTYNKDHPEDYIFPKVYSYTTIAKGGKLCVNSIILEYNKGYDKYLFNRMANKLLDTVSGADSEYEKALMLYNVLQQYVKYDYDALNAYSSSGQILDDEGIKAYDAYGAIVNGKAVCEGYAEAYQYLLQRLGIECYIVTGNSKKDGGAHEWNLIKLDGKYYHADITWDDVGALGNLYHNYFNITTEKILEGHTIEDPYGLLPNCTDINAAYKYKNVITSLDVDKIANLFTGGRKKTANFYFTGLVTEFKTWWQSNYKAVFDKISGLQGGISYNILFSAVGNEYVVEVAPSGYGAAIGGTFLSWGNSDNITTLELFKDGATTPLYTKYLEGNFNFWTLDDVKNGSYKLKVSKPEHKTREYTITVSGGDAEINGRIFLIGDVNEDGAVDVRDIASIKRHFASGVFTDSCDVDCNGTVDALDLTKTIEKLYSV